ncbi:hypothetical protein L21SP5_01094 [Salinivirga cyanobacteriivorans]|uniref:Phospholipid/glycerol acyltransferase domain-containing protein n=1 Tax=Salinivirga cyanobacteriivorans TaxID=1307839 RepID=A0A0S2HXL5_9BACT|nr:1-acyl-sn-glycerol-3-phosphate acyltransferase [Salinivirga cyanobacteriivorans]ALO14758.1 hypothetical protein L21SP5_01094 [Salinivirga cyanobacteriivorans]
MIKARHLAFYRWFYGVYSRIAISRAFNQVNVFIPEIDADKPLLVIANHHSWWDGFWVLNLNRRYWKKRFHVMMMLEQLRRHPTFRYVGAYSVQKGNRSVMESLEYTSSILGESKNMVLLYPQGIIQSQHVDYIKFQKGINKIINNSNGISVLMLVTLTDYFSHRRPGLWVYGELFNEEGDIELAYNDFYMHIKKQQRKWTG